jgi:hypothetical protein
MEGVTATLANLTASLTLLQSRALTSDDFPPQSLTLQTQNLTEIYQMIHTRTKYFWKMTEKIGLVEAMLLDYQNETEVSMKKLKSDNMLLKKKVEFYREEEILLHEKVDIFERMVQRDGRELRSLRERIDLLEKLVDVRRSDIPIEFAIAFIVMGILFIVSISLVILVLCGDRVNSVPRLCRSESKVVEVMSLSVM